MSEKVFTTNQFAFYLMIFHIFYLIVSIVKAPTLLQWPLMGILANLIVLSLNYLRLFTIARILLCTVPMSVVIIYNSYLTPVGAIPRMSGYLIGMVHTIIPFLVFDMKERIAQWSLFLVLCFTIVAMFPLSDLLIDPLLDYDLNYAPMSKRGLIIGLAGLAILLFLMQKEQLRYRNESEKLTKERVERNLTLEKSEKELKEALTQVQKTKQEDEERSWTTQNISDFNDLTRSVEDLDELIDHSASFLARVLNLNQVAVFTRKEDADGNDFLKKQSVYAYDRKKYLDKTNIERGEGLIGQCYIEKKPIIIKDVPQGYVNISSGLGDATASFVAIYPLLAYEKVEGVIEVAGFKELKEFELDFLKRICESLAITILNKIGAERLKELLKVSQEQAEQVRSQEEEMRQNLEEMTATQEELKRQKEEYVKEIDRLKMLLNS
ncbi:GAF domain-containing protein [Flammeovirga yaeyamensis]|uniref:GAF domain-containing protein n=1 Tax=Flammeovirga yaeyamensis TaxID=367791 RepID=A0AAX1N070_9BACT|nr:GAF domain-containing protein [Flammeovirga yaeyamensis]MBB3700178.1 GAF domain-containing protein [Flammeovirga yaeyamensis]NMF37192.1 GAF domain-containing protein [Flammeovirga yaeyamensis]QWG00882.1 GAF domain-containing protein [Flammeovirga yaeyamensis]